MIEVILLFGILVILGGLLAAVRSGFNEVIKGLEAIHKSQEPKRSS